MEACQALSQESTTDNEAPPPRTADKRVESNTAMVAAWPADLELPGWTSQPSRPAMMDASTTSEPPMVHPKILGARNHPINVAAIGAPPKQNAGMGIFCAKPIAFCIRWSPTSRTRFTEGPVLVAICATDADRSGLCFSRWDALGSKSNSRCSAGSLSAPAANPRRQPHTVTTRDAVHHRRPEVERDDPVLQSFCPPSGPPAVWRMMIS
mmetsp:Transcript_27117/g.82179  ORF Transcript_27117/g.82179 Transcript_27117/m.82179 type:complete len:209 (-) Transcript_27117:372-998(-)